LETKGLVPTLTHEKISIHLPIVFALTNALCICQCVKYVCVSGGMPEKQGTHLTRQSESVKKMLLELAHQKASQGKQSHVHLLPLLAGQAS